MASKASKPRMHASYSATLLVVGKFNFTDHGIWEPSGATSNTPISYPY
jgi:hypothetical protein